jgi:dolichol-phosphate mannosyltransferase
MESKFNYKNFSIVIPIYNEEEILEESTNAIFLLCKSIGIDFEIIFSENGSTDNTKKIANELINKYSEIKIIDITSINKMNIPTEALSILYEPRL